MQNDLKEQTEKAFNFDAFGKFRSADEIAEKAKATGTGLLTAYRVPDQILFAPQEQGLNYRRSRHHAPTEFDGHM